MDLASFLELINKSSDLPNSFIVNIYSKDRCPIFFISLFNYYKTLGSCDVNYISLQDINFDQIQFNLSATFLSNKSIYFAKDFDLANPALKNNLLNFFKSYSGPNLIFFSDTLKHAPLENSKSVLFVDIPDKISHQTYNMLFNFFYPNYLFDSLFIFRVLERYPNLNLDQAIILMQYQISLGRRFENFFDIWLDKIIYLDKSLFILSQNLFNQDFKVFFDYWSSYKDEFPEEFWIPYFSEQIWQASIFVHMANSFGIIEAKKNSNRLPFSFINKQYKNFTFSFLSNAHDELYKVDHNFKNGIGQGGLDLWLTKFIMKQFP